LSLEKPQDKHMLLKQQSKSKHIWPKHKSTRARTIINDQKHKPYVVHKQGSFTGHVPQQEKCGASKNSSQNRGRNHPTEGHVYMGNEHHDEANMGRNQSIDMKLLSLF
jgi:hypothetical protein